MSRRVNKNGITKRRVTFINGERVELPVEAEGTTHGTASETWRRHVNHALACHPSQSKEFNEKAKKAGLTGVHYRKDGRVEISSAGQYKKELKHREFVNHDAYS